MLGFYEVARMAKKTIVYEATITNGHGQKTEHFVAPTKAQLKKCLENENVKVDIRSVGQKEVKVVPDQDDGTIAQFVVVIDEKSEVTVSNNDVGYKFLRSKFQPQVDRLEDELNK